MTESKKKQQYSGKNDDINLMKDEGGLTKLIEEIMDIPEFLSEERTLKFKPEDKRTHQLIKNNLDNLAVFIRQTTMNQTSAERIALNKSFRKTFCKNKGNKIQTKSWTLTDSLKNSDQFDLSTQVSSKS